MAGERGVTVVVVTQEREREGGRKRESVCALVQGCSFIICHGGRP